MMRGGGRGASSTNSSIRERGSGSGPTDLKGTILGDLHTRPENFDKKGSSGRPAEHIANFVPFNTSATFSIYQYHVCFEPEVDAKHFRQQILTQESIIAEIGNTFIFDGMILYLNREWSREQILEGRHPITGHAVAVKFKNSVRFQQNDPQTINCFNIIVRRCLDQVGLKQMGRNYFDPRGGSQVVEYGLEIWPGVETAVRLYEGGLMLCVENRFKVLRTQNLLVIMNREYERCGKDIRRFQPKFEEQYLNSTIVTFYNNKNYRLTKVDWNMTPKSEFTKVDGTNISLMDYFKEQYNLTISDPDQPIIISEGKPKQPGEPPQITFLVPELCQPTGLTDDMRKDFRLMRALSHHTRLGPGKREELIKNLMQKIHGNEGCVALLQSWHLELGTGLVAVAARELPPETLVGSSSRGFTGRNAEWARECKSNGNFRFKEMANWIVVAPSNPVSLQVANKFIQKVDELGSRLAMRIMNPMCQTTEGTGVNDYIRGIKKALDQVHDKEIHMIVVILADDNKTRYDTIKKILCTNDDGGRPVPSQCILQSTLVGKSNAGGENKNFDSIVLKVLLQMNCKIGGALWRVNIPPKDLMIVGYDLYHDSTMKGKTVGACVSTIDKEYTQFYSQTRPHDCATELGTNLTHFMRKALRKYYLANNNTLPAKILLYRDGAGDGQIPYIRNTEVQLIKEACADVVKKAGIPNHEIKLAFTIVTKKVNMRLFRRLGKDLQNPNPGTVVDDIITRPERFDFYLIPQYVNQGTVTPVCYNVIYDDTGLSPDQHQKLAFKLCHLYYNWQGTVRVPAPCQYSHKLAFLVAQSIHKEVDEVLRDKLYYL